MGQGGEIWAAAGIYYENINIPMFVYVYGGFNRTEQTRDQRNWVLNETILYGRVSMSNSGYLLSSIDGFTIRNNGIICANSSPTIRSNVITSDSGHTVEGMEVDISGRIATNASGEKCITAEAVFPQGYGQIDPVGMCGKFIGGDDWRFNFTTGVGQRGITGAFGLNNIGLLITTWGKVTAFGRGWFYLDDGSRVEDGTGTVGIYVDAEGMIVPAVGSSVIVTGISGCEYYLGNLVNVLLVRRQNDILVLTNGSANAGQSTSDNPSPRYVQSKVH